MGEDINKFIAILVLPGYSIQLTGLTVIKRGFWKPVVEEIPVFINKYLQLISFFTSAS